MMEFLIPSSFRSLSMRLNQITLLHLCTSLQSGCIIRLCQTLTHHAFSLLGKILNFMWHLWTLLFNLGIPCSEWTNSSNWLVPFCWKKSLHKEGPRCQGEAEWTTCRPPRTRLHRNCRFKSQQCRIRHDGLLDKYTEHQTNLWGLYRLLLVFMRTRKSGESFEII